MTVAPAEGFPERQRAELIKSRGRCRCRHSRAGKRHTGPSNGPSSSRKMLSEHFLTSIQLEKSRDPDSVVSHGSFRALE